MVVRVTDDQSHAAAHPGPSADPPTEVIPAPASPTPALLATGLGWQGGSGWIFREVSVTVPPGSLAAIVGPAGSGRSSLLLTLAGRMTPTAGVLSVLGHDVADDPSAVRELTSVARAAGSIGPEPALTVRESIEERCLIDDVASAEGHTRFQQACQALQFSPDPSALVESVVGEQATLLAVALAYLRTSAAILLDDLDRDIPLAVRAPLLQALRRLAGTGTAIIATATDRSAVGGATRLSNSNPQPTARGGRSIRHPRRRRPPDDQDGQARRLRTAPIQGSAADHRAAFPAHDPVVYGALYLWSTWDPYGKLDQVPVAVVNEDVPVTGPDGQPVDAGDRLVAELQDDPIFDWQFVDATTAADGLLREPGQRRHR
jgi:ABC-type Na+ transport system ATPase subunit NatA